MKKLLYGLVVSGGVAMCGAMGIVGAMVTCGAVGIVACSSESKDKKPATTPTSARPTSAGPASAPASTVTAGTSKATAPSPGVGVSDGGAAAMTPGSGPPPPPPAPKKLTATATATYPAELVGSWRSSGTVGGKKPGQRGMSWLKEYHFAADGTFSMNGYPPILVTGKWHVSKRDNARMNIVLTDQEMRASKHDKPSKWNDRADWAELQGTTLLWHSNKYWRMKRK